MSIGMRTAVGVLALGWAVVASGDEGTGATSSHFWTFRFENVGVKKSGTNEIGGPVTIYFPETDGVWSPGAGSSRMPGLRSSYWFSTSRYYAKPSGFAMEKDVLKGKVDLGVPPDPWVPTDGKSRRATFDFEAKVERDAKGEPVSFKGTYAATLIGLADVANPESVVERRGVLTGNVGPYDLPTNADYTVSCFMEGAIPGEGEGGNRRLAVAFGFENGACVGATVSYWDWRGSYGTRWIPVPANLKATIRTIGGIATVPYTSVDGDAVNMEFDLVGYRSAGIVVGEYTATCRFEDGRTEVRRGNFGGELKSHVMRSQYKPDEPPWWVPVKGWTSVQPGEHPRLFFRKSNLPELRRRAETPEGKCIVARLKTLLGGGEAMPTVFHPLREMTEDHQDTPGFKATEGIYTISHAAGFGFLYQLTGEKKYADLARKCVELGMEGQRDLDPVYALKWPWGELRAGPSIGWTAVAYDLCYDAWDPEFRQKLAVYLQNYENPPLKSWEQAPVSIKRMIRSPRQPGNSNHGGSVVGGCGLVVLAIRGDPGTDDKLLGTYDRILGNRLVQVIGGGFGDGGFFYEGAGPGQIATDTALIPYIQALRVAAGRDYVNAPRFNVPNLTMIRVAELCGPPATTVYRSMLQGSYGGPDFYNRRDGLARGGQFCQGFGTVRESDKPAMLWTYNHVVEPDESKRTFDTISWYPHRCILALVNWPFDVKERNPADTLPLAWRDSTYEYWSFRNRWQDNNDVIVSCVLRSPSPELKPRGVMMRSGGSTDRGVLRAVEFNLPEGALVNWELGNDRSAILKQERGSIAVDFSKASGSDAALIMVSSPKAAKFEGGDLRGEVVAAGGQQFLIVTVAADKHPEIRVEGDQIVLGGQRIGYKDGKITLSVFTPANR